MSREFSTEFSTEFDRVGLADTPPTPPPPTPEGKEVERWRLTSTAGGITVDWSAVTDMDFTVEMGRDDPDEQPQPGRASFTMHLTGSDRAAQMTPGAVVEFDVQAGTGAARDWYRVWTGTVTDVTRSYQLGRNTIRVDAVGPAARLQRLKIPDGMGGAYAEQRDGLRIWTVLYQLGVAMSTVRPESGHLVNDTFPQHASLWNATSLTVTGGTAAVFTRTTAMPAVTGAPRQMETAVAVELDRPAMVVVTVGGQVAEFLFLRAGQYLLAGEITLPTDNNAPTVTVTATPVDDVFMFATWADVAEASTTWAGMPAAATWRAAPAAGVSTTVTLLGVDIWRTGWDWGSPIIVARDPTDQTGQTAADHIGEVATAARGVLWEQRDGGLSYASATARAAGRLATLNLPARYVQAGTESTQTMSALVNDITVNYGYPPVDDDGQELARDRVRRTGLYSIAWFGGDPEGRYEATMDGPLRDKASAVAVAEQVLRASGWPRERLSNLQILPLDQVDEVTTIGLLTVPPGSLIQIDGVNAPGWVPSSAWATWVGYLEGWTVQGSSGGSVAITLAVSEYFESVAEPAAVGEQLGP